VPDTTDERDEGSELKLNILCGGGGDLVVGLGGDLERAQPG
jgi:hypothetical protein